MVLTPEHTKPSAEVKKIPIWSPTSKFEKLLTAIVWLLGVGKLNGISKLISSIPKLVCKANSSLKKIS